MENLENIDKYAAYAMDLLMEFGPKLLLAILTIWVGLKVIKWVLKLVRKAFENSKVEDTLKTFAVNLVGWTLKIILFISAASMVGIETTSFIALLGAAGLAIGMALQGALSNFAGGVMLLVFKPYKIGDVISTQGEMGQVEEIQMFTTIMLTPNSETIIVPNGAIISGNIRNLSAKGKIRQNIAIGISYDSDIKKAREVLIATMENHPMVLKEPAPSVIVTELADSSVNLAMRPWSTPDDYWDVMADIVEQGKIDLDKNNITIPFPQMDVHLEKLA